MSSDAASEYADSIMEQMSLDYQESLDLSIKSLFQEQSLDEDGYDTRDTTPERQVDNAFEPRENYADFNPQYSW